MIKMKELVKSYDGGRRCTRFEYILDNPEAEESPVLIGDAKIPIRFTDMEGDGKKWRLNVTLPKDEVMDSQTYTVVFLVPTSNMRLEVIAATGMKYLRSIIQQEIQKKATLDFAIGEIVEGM